MAYKNGAIPARALRRSAIGVSLRADAAASADRLAKEFEKKAGIPLRGTDGYREGVDQERIFRERYQTAYIQYAPGRVDRRKWNGKYYYRKPGFAAAAVPGTSTHGLGTAVDFADLPIGMLTALLGGPSFFWLLRRERNRAGGWA